MKFSLSYIIATRNRLQFLRITLGKLIDQLQAGEEIVVVDGNSSDGTKTYLQKLFDEGKIHQFISETDRNQAHGWNKAMLMATGDIVKKIIDDDVFCYKAIRECKNYMLSNPAVDIIISNDLSGGLDNRKNIEKHSRLSQFERWKKGETPSFTFRDVNMLVRRNSIAFIGLYNTSFIMMDWEYSLRISHMRARITYYTGYTALTVGHAGTVTSLKNDVLVNDQGKRACFFYEYPGDSAEISLWSKMKIYLGKHVKPLINTVKNKSEDSQSPEDIVFIYNYYYNYTFELNSGDTFEFLDSGTNQETTNDL